MVHFEEGAAAIAAAALILPPLALCLASLGLMRTVDNAHPPFNGPFDDNTGLRLRHVAMWSFGTGSVIGAGTVFPVNFEVAVMAGCVTMSIVAGIITWNARKAYAGALMAVAFLGLGATVVELTLMVLVALGGGNFITAEQAAGLGAMWLLYGVPSLVSGLIVAFISTRSQVTEADAVAERQRALDSDNLPSPTP